MKRSEVVTVEVQLSPDTAAVQVADGRPESLALFGPLGSPQRQTLALDAWTVGLRAVMNAHRHAEESRLQDVGRAMCADLEGACRSFVERQEKVVVQVLARYFDPKDGQVVGRLERLLSDEGDLARTMDKYLAPERGAVAVSLAREVGEGSPLFRLLDPAASEGLVQVLQTRIQATLEGQSNALLQSLDPLVEDGAISRFLRALRAELNSAAADREKQLEIALAALDANDEGSLINRLVRETQLASQQLMRAMNPEVADSPLATLRSALATLLLQHAKAHQEALVALEARQLTHTQELRDMVSRLEERRRLDAKSIRGGFSFQDAVIRFVTGSVQGAPVIVEPTATKDGLVSRCKVGDLVLELNAESAFAGARVVVEAKREAGVTVPRALKELETARANRSASVGIMVLARSHAQAGFSPLTRHGRDILVLWDEADESTDPYLHAAILLALALASRLHKPEDQGDIAALSDIEHRVQAELERLGKMQDLAAKIEKHARELQDEVRKGGDKLELLLRKTKSTLRALNVEVDDAETAGGAITVAPGSLTVARGALAAPANDAGPAGDGQDEMAGEGATKPPPVASMRTRTKRHQEC